MMAAILSAVARSGLPARALSASRLQGRLGPSRLLRSQARLGSLPTEAGGSMNAPETSRPPQGARA